MSTVMASFNATVGLMTEMPQWPECASEKNDKCLSKKNRL